MLKESYGGKLAEKAVEGFATREKSWLGSNDELWYQMGGCSAMNGPDPFDMKRPDARMTTKGTADNVRFALDIPF